MRPRTSLTALVPLVLAAAFFPRPAAASFPSYRELGAELLETAENPPQLLAALEDAEQREDEREGCGVFCGEPLDLRLKVGLFGEDHERAWGFFGPPTPTGPNKYAKARFYDPQVGRFTTQDSFLGNIDEPPSLHRFTYAGNRPTFWTDPTGHCFDNCGPNPENDPRFREVFRQQRDAEIAATREAVHYTMEAAKGWGGAALEASVSLLRRGVRQSVGLAFPPLLAYDAVQDVKGLYQTGKENLQLVSHATTESVLDAMAERPDEAARIIGRSTFQTQGIAAGGHGAVAWARGLLGAQASVVVESSAVGETTTMAPVEGALPPAPPLPRVAGAPVQLRVLDPHFTPDPTRVLQNITTAQNQALAANPALARTVLSPAEYAAGQRSVPVARMSYGKSVERLSALEIEKSPLHRQLFERAGGPNRPDFYGAQRSPAAGVGFDITTPRAIPAHRARPYGPGLEFATYQRPPLFLLFP